MTHSVTVEFDDGTSHVYDNVPDNITNDKINERAQQEYADKNVVNINHVATPASEPTPAAPSGPAPQPSAAPNGPVAPGQEPSIAAQVVGGVQTGLSTAEKLGVTGAGVATAAGLYKGNQMINTARQGIDAYSQAQAAKTAATNAQTAQSQARLAERLGRGGQGVAQQAEAQAAAARQAAAAAPKPVPTAPAAPAPVAPQAPTVNPQQAAQAVARGQPAMAAESAPSLFSRAGTLASKYAPMMAKLGVAAQLALHSGDLNEGEDKELAKRRAQYDFQKRNGTAPF
jgi:hypothetical protein